MKKLLIFWLIILAIVALLFLFGPNRTIAGQPKQFEGKLTIQQVVKEFPWLSFVREFKGTDGQRWIFKYSPSAVTVAALHECPVYVNVGENPSKAEVNIAGIAALCEAYAIVEWVDSLHQSSPTPTPTPAPSPTPKGALTL